MPPTPRPLSRLPLPPSVFLILLSLADGDAHGYQIRKDVIDRSDGAVRLDPGSLYRLIGRLLADGLIADVAGAPKTDEDARRRYYRLTPEGRRVLMRETDRLADLVAQVRARGARRPRKA
jgi:DNA-binding PadR family transcriptional regulator